MKMKHGMPVAVLVILAIANRLPGQEGGAKKTEAKELNGVWKAESLATDGKELDKEVFDKWRWVVEGDKMTWSDGRGVEVIETFVVNPDKKPKEIDLTVTDGDDKGKQNKAIYSLEGDVLTICKPVGYGKERPTTFVSTPGSGLRLGIFKRVKP